MPCESKVRVWYDEKNNPVKYELICEGKCNDNDSKDCIPLKETKNTEQGRVETESCWCDGGDGKEVTKCHIVLVHTTPAPVASSKTTTTFKCKSRTVDCPDKQTCTPVSFQRGEVAIPEADGGFTGKMGQWRDFRCDCQPDSDIFGHWITGE